MSFTPSPPILEVLGLLEEEELAWISEEVEEIIAAGKTETFIVKESRLNGKLIFELGQRISPSDASVSSEKTRIKSSPFSIQEQAKILAGTLETYTIGVAKVIDVLPNRINEVRIDEADADISLILMNDITDKEFKLNSQDETEITEILKSIQQILADLITPSEQS